MRKIGIPEIEDIALGAALLGAGGGGDPYVGKLIAIGAVQECGPVTILDPDEVPDDALVVPIAMMALPQSSVRRQSVARNIKLSMKLSPPFTASLSMPSCLLKLAV